MTDDLLDVLNHELAGATLVDPCNPNKPHEALMSELIELLCGIDYYNREDILSEIDGLDHISLPRGVQTSCPRYYCILNKMINEGLGTTFVCQLLSGFDGSTGSNQGYGFGLHFLVADFAAYPNLNDNAHAFTSTISQGNDLQIFIAFNTINCSSSAGIDVFETIQHELIHADIKRRLVEDHGWNGSELTFTNAFHQLVLAEFGGQSGENEHNLMLEHYLNDMVNSLIEMNNGVGTYYDFVGLVLNGFPIEVLNYCGYTLQGVQVHYNNFLNFVQQPGGVNEMLLSCE